MAIEDINLYYIPNHQFANRQFFIGTKTAYLIDTITNIKVTENMVQSIQIPWDDNFNYVNLIGIGTKFYDVLGIDKQTFKERSIILNILLNPVVSFLSSGLSVSGYWERTPSKQHNGMTVNIGNDVLKTTRTVALPRLVSDGTTPSFYYQITAKYDIVNSDASQICSYCGIAPWSVFMIGSQTVNAYKNNSALTGEYWVPIKYIINDIDTNIGLPSNSIVDVSISARCPWRTATNIGANRTYYTMLDVADAEIPGIDLAGNTLRVIKIEGSGLYFDWDRYVSKTLTLTDYERFAGKVFVCDEMDNIVTEIPTELFNSSNQLEYYCYGDSDYGALNTHFKFGDRVIVWPEGHLPWVGDNWADYINGALTYDRAEMGRNVESVTRQQEIDTVAAMSNAMLTGAIGAASGNPAGAVLGSAQMGLGLITAEMTARLSREQLYAKQRNKENYIKTQPSSNYQVAYGLDYCNRSALTGGAKIKIQTPSNMTSTDFANYISYNGYPCGKYATFNLSSGYIEGTLYSVPVDGANPKGNGAEMDALRKEISNGVRIVTA